jgi:hypothetical protein
MFCASRLTFSTAKTLYFQSFGPFFHHSKSPNFTPKKTRFMPVFCMSKFINKSQSISASCQNHFMAHHTLCCNGPEPTGFTFLIRHRAKPRFVWMNHPPFYNLLK